MAVRRSYWSCNGSTSQLPYCTTKSIHPRCYQHHRFVITAGRPRRHAHPRSRAGQPPTRVDRRPPHHGDCGSKRIDLNGSRKILRRPGQVPADVTTTSEPPTLDVEIPEVGSSARLLRYCLDVAPRLVSINGDPPRKKRWLSRTVWRHEEWTGK